MSDMVGSTLMYILFCSVCFILQKVQRHHIYHHLFKVTTSQLVSGEKEVHHHRLFTGQTDMENTKQELKFEYLVREMVVL